MTRQANYMRRKRAGLRLFKVVADPQDVAEIVRACGLIPTDPSAATLAVAFQMVVDMVSSGELTLRVDK